MNTIIAGFVGPQEIIIIFLSFFFILVPFFIVFFIVRAVRKSKTNSERKWTVKEVEQQFNKYQESNESKKNIREYYPVKEGSKITLIQFNEIVDFSTANNFVFLTDVSGKDYLVESNLSELEGKLPEDFIRVHKSTIINRKLIQEVKKLANGRYDLVMKCEKERIISCSKSYNEKIKNIIDF
jgi:two-component system LytT family response regulator